MKEVNTLCVTLREDKENYIIVNGDLRIWVKVNGKNIRVYLQGEKDKYNVARNTHVGEQVIFEKHT